MSLPVAVRIARRELRGGLKGFRIFLACLALGVAAIAAVGTVRVSIERGLAEQGAVILGGDAEIQLTYRRASDEERQWMDGQALEVSEIIDFRSMVVVDQTGKSQRALTKVKAVDGAYPLYGDVVLAPDMPLAAALDGQGGQPGAVMEQVLADRLGLVAGDRFRLGDQDFILTAVLLSEPDNSNAGFSLGPRTIVRRTALDASGLLQAGTLYQSAYRMRLAGDPDFDALEKQAEAAIQGGGLHWSDSRNGAPGLTFFIGRLGTFLVLVGLAGLAVGGVGVAAAVRSYLDEKVGVIATLKSLGADRRTIFQIYAMQIGALTIVGIILGLIIGAAVPLLLSPLISASLPVPLVMSLKIAPLAEAALYGVLAAILFTLWPLARSENIKPAALFRDAALGLTGRPRLRYIIATGLVLIALVVTAAILTNEPYLTGWISFGVFLSFLFLVLCAQLMRVLARRLSHARFLRGTTSLRMALASVGGPGGDAVSVVLSLGLGLSVLAAIGQINSNMQNVIAQELPDIAPSYFVVDIQKDQLDGFVERLRANPAVSMVETAPMLRGVITRINDRPASEVAGDHWVVSGDRGVTYSQTIPAGTKVTKGTWWPADYSGPPQISFAATEADELGLSLGDTLTINILGREITGAITSFRDVDFSNAGMGFVLSMNPGAIAGAPHTFIATIYAETNAEAAILRDLADAYPNITAIRVRDAIDRVASLVRGVAAAITYGALATLVTGMVVLIGAAAAGERSRTYEGAILRTLGASQLSILANFSIRSAILGLAAGLVAIAAGATAGWAVLTFVMESKFSFEPVSAISIVLGGVALTIATGLVFSLRSLRSRPAQILRSRE